ncbi:hypothetical protein [Virgibacillus sp.]|uniref:hypothetical protein n=1 Tax=Virgibacillus sp. TaxID=1872700 RepID=UPI0017916E92|nr:hypothetical protein [Virgibacillus sp.]NWO14669.1 hypothetical protein [Virgibacillus sp.]
MDNKTSLKELVKVLDTQTGDLNLKVITLNDVQEVIGHLREDMDNINEQDVRFYFRDFHQTVRIMDELLRYTVDELNQVNVELHNTMQAIFEKVIKQEVQHEAN